MRCVSCGNSGSFNPRPHARGDQSSTQTLLSRLVSIHAPTRGATCFYGNGEELIKFQSTPPREGRRSSTRTLRPNCCFNPRPHARGDKLRTYGGKLTEFQSTPPREGRHLVHADGKATLFVSIHAPARGATFEEGLNVRDLKFQSTPPRGGRHYLRQY